MKVDLSRLLDRTVYKIDLNQSILFEDIKVDNDRDIKFVGPIKLVGSIYKTDEGIFLSANVEYQYSENCARCLKDFTNKVETVLSGRLVEKSKKEIKDHESDEPLIYHEGEGLNLSEPIVTSILLSLPMKSLCDYNCKGLCKKCGKDLNQGDCDCIEDNVDPRLTKLRQLFD